jgi:hypothetical protein
VRDRGIGSAGFKGLTLGQQLNPSPSDQPITRSPDHQILLRVSVVDLFLICVFSAQAAGFCFSIPGDFGNSGNLVSDRRPSH